jgi:hypothetical protein
MLREPSPQRGLFEADTMYLDFVGRNSFYTFLAMHRAEIFRDEPYAQFYSPTMGRPSVPPSLLATALVRRSSTTFPTGRRPGGRPTTCNGRWRWVSSSTRGRFRRACCKSFGPG